MITGTNSAGKGTLVDILKEDFEFVHYSVRTFLTKEMLEAGENVRDRDSFIAFANKLRNEKGGDYIVKKILDTARADGRNAVIESVRAKAEVDFLESVGAAMFSIDADPNIRYARAMERASVTDKVSYDAFLIQQAKEWDNSDPTRQSIKYCFSRTPEWFRFLNNGTPRELRVEVHESMKCMGISASVQSPS